MNHQREYLSEDIEQIRRYFPGATIIEVLSTPFDIEAKAIESSHRVNLQSNRAVDCPNEAIHDQTIITSSLHQVGRKITQKYVSCKLSLPSTIL